MHVADVELGEPLSLLFKPEQPAAHKTAARLIVRLHGHPLGMVDVLPDELTATSVGATIWAQLKAPIQRHFELWHKQTIDALPEGGVGDKDSALCSWRAAVTQAIPQATIVINSCAASERLAQTVISALGQDYPNPSVMVVDNRPATSGIESFLSKRLGEETRLQFVAAPIAGLGRARNAGLRAGGTAIVAFTDDDVVLDPGWLGWLVAGFDAAEHVGCVTGLIVPLELETPAQLFMEEFSGLAKGFEQRIWDRDEHRLEDPLYPYTVGLFGSGASAAFRREVLLGIGGFDPHLGIGTPAIGGEDIDLYTRMVLAGHRIVYQPASLLRHLHRREMSSVDRQIRGYGAGLTAMLTKHLLTDRTTRRAVLRRVPAGVRHALSPRSPKNARKPAEFTLRQSLLEWAGMAYGPIGYLRSLLAG